MVFPDILMPRLMAFLAGLFLVSCSAVPYTASKESALTRDTVGRPATEVLVNGRGPFSFVVDTAAQSTAIGNALVDELGLLPHPEKTARIHGAGGVIEVPLYPIATVTVGGITLTDVLAPTLAHENDSDAWGIIGMDSFANRRITFDQRRNTLRIESRAPASSSNPDALLPIDFVYSTFARITINVDGVLATAVVDTGAKRSIGNLKLMAALGLTNESPGITSQTQSIGVTGHEANIIMGYEARLSLGAVKLEAIQFEFSDLPVFNTLQMSDGPALILGNDALIQLGLFGIDFRERQFYVTQ